MKAPISLDMLAIRVFVFSKTSQRRGFFPTRPASMHDAVITTARAAFGKKPVERNQLPMPLGLWAFEPVLGAADDGAHPFDTGWDDAEWPKRAVWAFKRRSSPDPTSSTSALHAWTARLSAWGPPPPASGPRRQDGRPAKVVVADRQK